LGSLEGKDFLRRRRAGKALGPVLALAEHSSKSRADPLGKGQKIPARSERPIAFDAAGGPNVPCRPEVKPDSGTWALAARSPLVDDDLDSRGATNNLSHSGEVERQIDSERWWNMAHVPIEEESKGVIPQMARLYAKKKFGQSVEPVAAASHHSGVLVAMGALETAADKGWRKLDPTLRWLAIQEVSTHIGCSWCIDFGYYEGMNAGIDPEKVRAASHWRDSHLFDDRERVVLEYAEQATLTPAVVSDELAARLHAQFTDTEIVELAAWVALENFRSRFNAGLGLHSQGFAEECEVPLEMARGPISGTPGD